ncbi:MAG: DEAD/DEAH box helicase [Treponema sp.]|nr:DEAD/DEAH box helicase [Treponema sp.]
MEFKELSLHPDLQRGIAETEYITCMPVQEQVLTNAFGGQDLYVQSQTGTGKTAAFLIVIFQRLLSEDMLAGKKALIMAPTRELAVQIEEEAKMLAKYLPFKVGSFYGGVGYTQQEKLLRENVQIMVGTPGRVLDLNKSGKMNLMDIAFLVLDEADRMFDMGFYPDLRKLIKVVPPANRRQTMLFSATLNAWVKNLAWEYTSSPFEIEIKPEVVTVEEIDQVLYHVPSEEKMNLLLGILEREQPESAIIFCNTKRYTEIVAKRLRINGYDCEFIIGDLPQSRRLKVIDDVKAGKTKFLVATDVAARGLDIEGLSMVVNYDLPNEAENYVHRIGRTARAGKSGRAITLASEQDVYELPAIERYIGKKIPSEITAPELHAEDKSAGQHIRTDFAAISHEGRRDDRRPTRSPARSPRDKAGKGNTGASRHGERQDKRRGGKNPRDEGQRHNRRQGNEAETSAHKRGAGGRADGKAVRQNRQTQDLSHLSFDERMALYKQKYDSSASGTGGLKTGGEKAASNAKHKRDNQEQRSGQRPGRRPERRQGKNAGQNQRGKAQDIKQQSKPAATAKKSLFSRLLEKLTHHSRGK